MAYDQGGANGVPTKKALKERCNVNPSAVYLYTTSAFGGFEGMANELPEGIVFNVVGPDPYTKRNWYASVSRRGEKVTVK